MHTVAHRDDKYDRIGDAVSHPFRREILLSLYGAGHDDPMAVSQADLATHPELVHNHLPKLDDLGFIDWDPETDSIIRGPAWDEIEPVLEMIDQDGDLGEAV